MQRGIRTTLATLIASVAGALVLVPAADARDAIVESFDDTPIIAHFYPGAGVSESSPAPTIMIGPGWGGSGETDPDGGSIAAPREAGYNVLTWDPRGFGGSGGTVMIDDPEFEGRDAQALVDFIAEQPEAQLDEPGDPRLGMAGGSYGGGIQLVLAGIDDRVDAITPQIAWNSQVSSLFKADKVKIGWGLALAGAGIPTAVAPGIFSPAGVQTGQQSPEFYSTVTEGAATGTVSDVNREFFADNGPDFLLDEIKIPTLLIQGTVDTLFTLDEAIANHAALSKQGVPLKMIYFCGGHGVCLTGSDSSSPVLGGSALAEERRLQWFDRYLREDASIDTGPAFEWIDENADFHTSERFPPDDAGSLTGEGSGTLPLAPGVSPPPGSGLALFGTPQDVAVKAPIPAEDGQEVVGTPSLALSYSGTAEPAKTHVFAQLVDKQRNVVVGNQVTPIAVTLDGGEHELTVPLESIASLSTTAGYELQIISASTVYDIQRSAGLIEIGTAKVTLPVTTGFTEPSEECLRYPFGSQAGEPLLGSSGPDCLKGFGGDDEVDGLGGDDELRGGGGDDEIAANGGADDVRGGNGADRIRGGGGADKLTGGADKDRIMGGPGRDKIKVIAGNRDVVRCGKGKDVVRASRGDRVSGCERVIRK